MNNLLVTFLGAAGLAHCALCLMILLTSQKPQVNSSLINKSDDESNLSMQRI
ncbi:hypothetical protein [Legionella worsleiensis]|uniref:hypothetical protein n=1 Tax=Legionella worsleiensis TaxID=45076 RepID=UPI000AF0AD4F|nr:hypothetical protein [Legionella worsleiensis]